MIINNITFIGTINKHASKIGIIIFLMQFVLSCTEPNYRTLILDYFDSNNRTITITDDIDLLTIGIKEIFLSNNWQINIFDSTSNIESINFDEIETQYVMSAEYTIGDDLFYGNFIRDYKITIYDTDNSSEVVILYGDGRTLESLLKEIEEVIESNNAI